MRKVLRWGLGALSIAALAGLLIVAVTNRANLQRENDRASSAKPPGRVSRNLAGDAVLTLDAPNQDRIGLQVEALQAAKLPREVTGYGRVLDPEPLITFLEEITAAEAQAEAARTEHDRLKALQESVKGIARRAVEAAKADLIGRQGRVRALVSRMTNLWGEGIASLPSADREAWVDRLVKRQAALVRVDLPAGVFVVEAPSGAAIVLLAADGARLNASRVFEAPGIDEKIQGQGFILDFESPPRALRPGAVVSAYLQLPGDPADGVLVPRSAVVRLEGMPWVYVQGAPDKFFRREVHLDHLIDGGWFTRSGFAAGDRVVVAGAQTLLSDELRYQIQLEDE